MKVFLVIVLNFFLSVSASADVPAVAASCIACHGETGVSANGLWPNLAGQKQEYLQKQIRAFRSGERKDPVMNAVVAALTDTDVDVIAKYFSQINKPK